MPAIALGDTASEARRVDTPQWSAIAPTSHINRSVRRFAHEQLDS
jgi:hypothetical protein